MNKKIAILIIVFVVAILGICVLALGITAYITRSILLAPPIEQNTLAIGSLAPDFEATSVEGESFRLSQFRGQPVLLTFSATWCPDCQKEAPLVQELHEKHPELVIFQVNKDEGTEIIEDFMIKYGITHPILLDDDGSIHKLYRIFAIPTEFFIDADGVIQAYIIESVTPNLLAENLPLIAIQP